MEKESQRLLESVMKLIAAQFGPDCEVVLHDWSKEYESTIVAIENGHVSGRKVGDGGSNLGLEVMRGTTDGSNQLNYITQTQDGRMLRSSSLYLTDENGKKVGALCINLDVTDYIMMQHRLSGVTLFPCVRPGEQEVSREFFTNDVNELLDYLIKEGTEQIGKAPEEMTKEEKKQMMLRHFNDVLELKGEYAAVREMRKHVGWYLKGLPGSAAFRGKINQITSAALLREAIQEI